MTIKTYLKNQKNEYNVNGLWWTDELSNLPKNYLEKFEEFKNITIEFIKDIRKEHINSMMIIKNLTNELFNIKIRLYSIYLDGNDVYYNISKDSLKNIKF